MPEIFEGTTPSRGSPRTCPSLYDAELLPSWLFTGANAQVIAQVAYFMRPELNCFKLDAPPIDDSTNYDIPTERSGGKVTAPLFTYPCE